MRASLNGPGAMLVGLGCTFVAVLAGCGVEGGGGGSRSAVIGPAGGTVMGPDGARVVVPAGALSADVEISISASTSGFRPLPALAGSGVYSIEPHGLEFAVPVTVILPHGLGPGEAAMWTSSPGGAWERLTTRDQGGETAVEVMHFSFFFNGREVCGLYRQECCDSTEPDGECSGALYCDSSNRCRGCGFAGEPCCAGDVCLETAARDCGPSMVGTGEYMCREGTCQPDCSWPGGPEPAP